MKKVENQKQVYETFQLLGIKDVTTKRQLKMVRKYGSYHIKDVV